MIRIINIYPSSIEISRKSFWNTYGMSHLPRIIKFLARHNAQLQLYKLGEIEYVSTFIELDGDK